MGTDKAALLADLAAECGELDELVTGLSAAGWATTTPAPGWTIAHQIAHLRWTDEQALLAATDPESFQDRLATALAAPERFVDDAAQAGAAERPAELLAGWRGARSELIDVLAKVPDGTKIPWYATPMSAASMATARLMEVWAHGLDVADALDVERQPTERLRHVAYLGVRTRDFAFRMRQLTPPTTEFRVELRGPGGELWSWGPADALESVTGSAVDFCYLVTQRRHRADTDLRATGEAASTWLDIAQAFAGPRGVGRQPGQFR
ncbi:uncharacterized protein (TIGR03084 family) [Tamaricihabitans halophyticus]|uniref:Uncharacterized protein (TIGR03084 family) n=1 Tax=Tamaricihabitans halophyticus TaxID=1262583 RepID=A0A4R2Q1Z9_9PSEU|nr:TIGR03084 family metal-binding protein [Tamaricihabitans halophyticus]TCP41638.1 uncharacterized protein (TIGR03084 family) [Tamaricihabitans halophyticus]